MFFFSVRKACHPPKSSGNLFESLTHFFRFLCFSDWFSKLCLATVQYATSCRIAMFRHLSDRVPIYYCIGFGNGKGLRIFFKAESDITSMYLLTPVAPIANLLLYPLRLPRNHRKNCTTAWRILKSFLKASVGDISFFSFQRPTESPKYYNSKVYCLLFT